MNVRRKHKKRFVKNNQFINIDKNFIKEIIVESYKEVEEQRRLKHTPTEFLKLPLNLIFVTLVVVLGFLSIVFLIVPIPLIYTMGWSPVNVASGMISISIAIICGIFALVCYKTNKEVEKETDRYYIVAYFSAIVSLVALVIALIGLLRW